MEEDFTALRIGIEDASQHNMPKTTGLQMGVRYPERFPFQNPSPGVYGTLTTYPVNITVSYKTQESSTEWKNYTSSGIIYQANGQRDQPKLVYENGLIIKDFGTANLTDDTPTLFNKDNIFIPTVNTSTNSIASMELETFNLKPPSSNYTAPFFNLMNITIETRYPQLWTKLISSMQAPKSSTASVTGDKIHITNIPGYNVTRVKLPEINQSDENQLDTGLITIDSSTMLGAGPTGIDGQYMWAEGHGRANIPASADIQQFIVKTIPTNEAAWTSGCQHHEPGWHHDGELLRFSVTDDDNTWTVEVDVNYTGTSLTVEQM